jgi:short subunit dehydrogenase-like uncharacterized protein
VTWTLYGANGYTGRLIVAEALRRGMRPVLAGRNAAALRAMGTETGLPVRTFGLEDPNVVRQALKGQDLVLHCAGPFSATSAPVLDACLAVKAHYLDITGEIDVFAAAHARDADAKAAGIVVLPGAGFDVVPTDCLAARLKAQLPEATELVLAFEAGGGPSPGTAKTGVEGLGQGGRARIDGELRKVPLAWKTRKFDRAPVGAEPDLRLAMTIPWGDLYTAWVSTGIPNIETYLGVSPGAVSKLRMLRKLGFVLGTRPVQAFLKSRVTASVPGPTAEQRAKGLTTVWGEVRDPAGRTRAERLRTPNGYDLTVTASLGIVERLVRGEAPAGGFYTPSRLMGPDYVLSLPGVKLDGQAAG